MYSSTQIGWKWALDLLSPFVPVDLEIMASYWPMTNTQRAKEVHPSGSAIQAEKKGTSSVALQVPFWATWACQIILLQKCLIRTAVSLRRQII